MSSSKTVHSDENGYARPEVLPRLGQQTWSIVRLPILAFLVVLEPVICFVLSALSLLGILMTFFFRWTYADPRFPFWTMLLISIGFAVALYLYEGLIGLFSRR